MHTTAFFAIIRAYRIGRSILGGAVKEENHALNLVQLDEIRSLTSQLLRAQKITATRSEHATTSVCGRSGVHLR